MNVCNKVIQPRLPRQSRLHKNARHIFFLKRKKIYIYIEKPVVQESHVNFHKTPKPNRRRGTVGSEGGGEMCLNCQWEMSVSPSRRRGNHKWALECLDKRGAAAAGRPRQPSSESYAGHEERRPPGSWEIYLVWRPDVILTRASHIFCGIFFFFFSWGASSVATSQVLINGKWGFDIIYSLGAERGADYLCHTTSAPR